MTTEDPYIPATGVFCSFIASLTACKRKEYSNQPTGLGHLKAQNTVDLRFQMKLCIYIYKTPILVFISIKGTLKVFSGLQRQYIRLYTCFVIIKSLLNSS